MKRRGIVCILIFSVCSVFLAPKVVSAEVSKGGESAYRELLFELIETLQKQIAVLQAELAAQPKKNIITEQSPLRERVDSEAVYQLERASDVDLIPNPLHRKYFQRVFQIFPLEYSNKLEQLEVFQGETADFDSFVETLPPDHTKWLYAASGELFSQVNSQLNTELIVHELAHMISYEEIVGVPKPAETTCHSYFDTYGCPAENSYLGVFTKQFWSEVALDRAARLGSPEAGSDTTHSYYREHEEQFVSEYAALNPEEDFAESFVFFILDRPVEGSIAAQKIAFFSQYPKLLLIRDQVRAQL